MDADGEFKRLLESVDSIAALGIKDGPQAAAFRISADLQRLGHQLLSVEPKPRAVWRQGGTRHYIVSVRLEHAGIAIVRDGCLRLEHRRLLGGTS